MGATRKGCRIATHRRWRQTDGIRILSPYCKSGIEFFYIISKIFVEKDRVGITPDKVVRSLLRPYWWLTPRRSVSNFYLLRPSRLQAFERSVINESRLPTKIFLHFGHWTETLIFAFPSARISPSWHQGHLRWRLKSFPAIESPLMFIADNILRNTAYLYIIPGITTS